MKKVLGVNAFEQAYPISTGFVLTFPILGISVSMPLNRLIPFLLSLFFLLMLAVRSVNAFEQAYPISTYIFMVYI